MGRRHRHRRGTVIAKTARDMGILYVERWWTKPFHFEGQRRMRTAPNPGIAELHKVVDTLLIIPNQNLVPGSPRK